MIIKGGSRAGPVQLAWHLQRRDTNESVDILELQSPAENLKEAFRDWQTLAEGTCGIKGLYHANIDPAKDYVMTPQQWQYAVDILEEELKLTGQPRAVIMHEKHGRQHIHVVWARTDIDRMVLCSDSYNYLAHERASQRLELEFGHEPVPGKHAKRDREKQPEFPRAEANQAEWQEGERTGITPAERKDQITALRQTCDTGQSFKTALEEQGYILARGDRGFVIVDENGSIHSLARQLRDMKTAEVRAFMKDVDLAALPSAEEAQELQRQRQEEQLRHDHPRQDKAKEEGADARIDVSQPQELHQEAQKPAPKPSEAEPASAPPAPVPDPLQAQTEGLKKAVSERQAEERRRLIATQTAELNELREAADRDSRRRLERFDAIHQEETQALGRRQNETRAGLAGFVHSVRSLFSPARAREREVERQRERDQLALRQKQERDDYAARLDQTRQLEIENVTERQALRLQEQAARGEEDLARYLHEHEVTNTLRAEYEERERERAEEKAREENVRDAPERPPPKRAR